ncbi:MAG TPA: terminase [Chloroflexia bacterium]
MPPTNLWELDSEGCLSLNFHEGQSRGWLSDKRFIFLLAGTQGGKTSYIPWWLWRETGLRGPGDYLAVTSSYDLFKLKFLPSMREVFEHILGIGRYWSNHKVIELADPVTRKFKANKADDDMWGRIILRSAESGGGLESSTAKAAALDECGQDAFTVETWQAVLRRVSLNKGRVLGGTTIYNMGWIKSNIYDPWELRRKQPGGHPEIEVIQFDSTANPSFPEEEYIRARDSMPLWKFNMFYRGMFERPAGLIYDSFDEKLHKRPRFTIPDSWERYLGLDFGGVNTAALFYAEEPDTGKLYLYREYKAGGRTAKEHAERLLDGEPMVPLCFGGSHSEGQWRREFGNGGLPVREPAVREVEVGIGRVYGAHKRGEIIVFDDLHGYLEQKLSYARKLDVNGEPTEEIADKSSYHFMDAERYIVGALKRGELNLRISSL